MVIDIAFIELKAMHYTSERMRVKNEREKYHYVYIYLQTSRTNSRSYYRYVMLCR